MVVGGVWTSRWVGGLAHFSQNGDPGGWVVSPPPATGGRVGGWVGGPVSARAVVLLVLVLVGGWSVFGVAPGGGVVISAWPRSPKQVGGWVVLGVALRTPTTHHGQNRHARFFPALLSRLTGVVRPIQAGRAAYGPPPPSASIQKTIECAQTTLPCS